MLSPVGSLTSGLRGPRTAAVGTTYTMWRGLIVDVTGYYTIVCADDTTSGAGLSIYLAAGVIHPLPGTKIVSAASGSTTITIGY